MWEEMTEIYMHIHSEAKNVICGRVKTCQPKQEALKKFKYKIVH